MIKSIFIELVEGRTIFFKKSEIEFVPVAENLVDAVWEMKPEDSLNPVFRHEDKYVGQTAAEKIAEIGKELKLISSSAILTSKLDEIACKFNKK